MAVVHLRCVKSCVRVPVRVRVRVCGERARCAACDVRVRVCADVWWARVGGVGVACRGGDTGPIPLLALHLIV